MWNNYFLTLSRRYKNNNDVSNLRTHYDTFFKINYIKGLQNIYKC